MDHMRELTREALTLRLTAYEAEFWMCLRTAQDEDIFTLTTGAWEAINSARRLLSASTDLFVPDAIKVNGQLRKVRAALDYQEAHVREVREGRRRNEKRRDDPPPPTPQPTYRPEPRHPHPSLENMERDYRRRMDHWNVPGEGM
jgi:hypothetical protein